MVTDKLIDLVIDIVTDELIGISVGCVSRAGLVDLLTSTSDSVWSMKGVLHALFSSDTRHCPMMKSRNLSATMATDLIRQSLTNCCSHQIREA